MRGKRSQTSKRANQQKKQSRAAVKPCKQDPFRLKAGLFFNDTLGFPGEGPEFRVVSANVTAWSSFTRSFDAGKFPEADLICMQEHKQSSKAAEMPAAQAWCKKLGFAHSFKEAIIIAKEGRSSGVALL